MRVLETERLVIRPFVLDDAGAFRRLLEEAFGQGSYGTEDRTRVLLEYNVVADKAHDALHQTPYEDRAIVLRTDGNLVGAVGFAACLAPFGQLKSFGATPHRTSEVGLFWALFPDQWGKGYATEAARAMVTYAFDELELARIVATTENDNLRSIAVMKRLGMTIERNPLREPHWFQTVGVLMNPVP
jgi:[ribosomal protein S5]-alanine N-acetyltransferase